MTVNITIKYSESFIDIINYCKKIWSNKVHNNEKTNENDDIKRYSGTKNNPKICPSPSSIKSRKSISRNDYSWISFRSSHSSNEIQCKNISPSLANFLEIQDYNRSILSNISKQNSWVPPNTYGLQNSKRIIPDYYFTNHSYNKIFDIDYYHIILDDIRNMRPLNEYQIDFIKELHDRDKMKIIKELNNVMDFYSKYISICDNEVNSMEEKLLKESSIKSEGFTIKTQQTQQTQQN